MPAPPPVPPPLADIRQAIARRQFDAAIARLLPFVEHPAHAPWARERLAFCHLEAGRWAEADTHLRAALALPPRSAEQVAALAKLCTQLMRLREAAVLCAHPLVHDAADPLLQAAVGHSAMAAGEYALARERFARAVALGNRRAHATRALGVACSFLGELDEAERQLEASLGQEPYLSHTHWSLAKLRRQTPQHNHVERLQARLARPGLETDERANLGYALFKELDDLGHRDEAWAAWCTGAAAAHAAGVYDAGEEREVVAAMRSAATTASAVATSDADAPMPIFIVGLPRSGTTVVDRILGGHSAVTTAGELNELPWLLRLLAATPGPLVPDRALLAATGRVDAGELGRCYLERTAWRAGQRRYYTDKLPHNFWNVGWIRAALPQARILHLVRNPMDVCWSNLKERFVGGYDYSNDLDDMAAHYHGYRQLMAHWHAAFPGAILDVDYDALVADPEPWARRILDFCGLPFEPQCLRIEDNAAPVATASAAQVREGIHRRASGQWARYAAQLQPLRARLQAYGYLDADGAPSAA